MDTQKGKSNPAASPNSRKPRQVVVEMAAQLYIRGSLISTVVSSKELTDDLIIVTKFMQRIHNQVRISCIMPYHMPLEFLFLLDTELPLNIENHDLIVERLASEPFPIRR